MVHIEGNTLRLSGEAVIHCAQELHDELAAALPRLSPSEAIVFDVSQLDALDLLGAQILLAARARLDARRVRFIGWSVPINLFLTTSGLAPHFA
jgi:anti-anti-sigma regulatory factor